MLLEMDFTELCFTAISIEQYSEYGCEEEVPVLSETFFEVTQIQEDDSTGLIIVSLKNVLANKDALSAII